MSVTRRLQPLLLAALALTGCRDSPHTPPAPSGAAAASSAQAAAAPVGPDGAYRLRIDGVAVAGRPALQFTLIAASPPGPDGTLGLKAIEVRQAGAYELMQHLDGLDTQTPTTTGTPILEQIDLDFDGIPDIRVIESLPAGPNLPYRNWRYDRSSARFVASPELDELSSPIFDAQRQEIRSDWRDNAARYGSDTLAWRNGRLEPQARVVREADSAGKTTELNYTWSGTGWVLQGAKPARQP